MAETTYTYVVDPPKKIDQDLLRSEILAAFSSLIGLGVSSVDNLIVSVSTVFDTELNATEQGQVGDIIEAHFPAGQRDRLEFTFPVVNTTNATPTTIANIPAAKLPNNVGWRVECDVAAVSSGGLLKTWKIIFAVKKVSGAISQVGTATVVAVASDSGLSTAALAGSAGAGGITLTGTGVASTNIDWIVDITVRRYKR